MKRLIACLLMLSATCHAQVQANRTVKLMGSRCDISIVAQDYEKANKYIDTVIAEITRIENLISDWKPETQVSAVNRNAGIAPVKVDREVLELTERALHFSKITDGAFDISFAAMERIWKFDGSMTEMPTPEAVKKSVEKVGYENIIIDKENSTIFLKLPGMKIGFGALGEGYAADRCKKMMLEKGVKAGIVNGSGDMNTWGTQPDGSPWTVGITNPMNKNRVFAVFPLHQSAVVTSGSYEKFALINGKRYAHIINPVTGYPATGLCSVTVMGPSAELANGFSTSIMVLGKDAGLNLINQFPQLSCIMVTDTGEVFSSKNIDIKKYQTEEIKHD
ncbi:thiamine biosynthesis protein ApbE [Flavobacterium akiainvivens]|uniref:FAD:protein FMN transferase n=1 Tax=Flavobacterium akiainvivens TaxID=1202724 RepID=A0A0M9VJS3_9FLAO|nr:FAD:protein FMN transferase [Flavobacterium akiainvivens]KOS08090.1 thiamine biosynthesis protein ApbE [Flavobacterium akiainvivens]SFQ71726.1 thiamine biosynthesis lipoprotein [Flavobacterium akiainvivens]